MDMYEGTLVVGRSYNFAGKNFLNGVPGKKLLTAKEVNHLKRNAVAVDVSAKSGERIVRQKFEFQLVSKERQAELEKASEAQASLADAFDAEFVDEGDDTDADTDTGDASDTDETADEGTSDDAGTDTDAGSDDKDGDAEGTAAAEAQGTKSKAKASTRSRGRG